VQLRQSMESLEQRAQELATLNTLGQRVGATISLDQVVQAAIEGVAGATQCDLALFFLRGDGELRLQGVGPMTSPFADQDAPAYRVGERLCGLAVSEGKPIFFRDAQVDPRCTCEEYRKSGLHSFAALPLYSGDEIVGALGLASATERDFGAQAIFLETMANQIAAASQNALLHKQVQRHADELEQRVAERTAQLEAANKELEAFSYSVSHDLRAPLRHIDGFLELLQKRIATALDECSRHYMTTISDSAKRMETLIDDLLSFSRMGRHEMSKAPVDLGDLVREIVREFAPEAQGRTIHWRIADLPTITGDQAMLRIVLVNLISNALKFTRPRQPAEIEIGCLLGQDTETIVFVRDNGVGFDMAYADKLFGVFERLHRTDEFEGAGIGLANVRRIITRHGGRTWAEGQIDQGATFYFSLPYTFKE
jgi:signal transduction histidine kinase